MERQPIQDILVSTQSLLLEVAEYLTSNTPRTAYIRPKNDGTHFDAISVFHTRIHSDLLSIEGRWRKRPDRCLSEREKVAGITLLTTVEDHFIFDSDIDDTCDSDGGEDSIDFSQLRQLLKEASTNTAGRVEWLLARLNLENPKPKHQRRIIKNLLSYLKALGAPEEPYDHRDSRAVGEWKEAGILFERMGTVHRALQDQWVCHCLHVKHNQHVKLSVGTCCDTPVRSNCYAMIASDGHKAWKPVLVHVGDQKEADPGPRDHGRTAKDSVFNAKSKHKQTHAVKVEETSNMNEICRLLEKSTFASCVELSSGRFLERKAQNMPAPLNSKPTPLPLIDEVGGIQIANLQVIEFKSRLKVALVLAYAYLHLGGGDLWPYNKVFSHLCMSDIGHSTGEAVEALFLAVCTQETIEKGAEIPRIINPGMPSLPVLGIMILSLASGKVVSWNTYEAEIMEYEHEMFGQYVTQAVKACLRLDTFRKEGETIKSTERVRMTFIEKVIKNLQFVLEVGYQADFDKVFSRPCPLEVGNPNTQSTTVRAPLQLCDPKKVDSFAKRLPSFSNKVDTFLQSSPASSRGRYGISNAAQNRRSIDRTLPLTRKPPEQTRKSPSSYKSWSRDTEVHMSSHRYTGNQSKDSSRVVNGNTIVHGDYHHHDHTSFSKTSSGGASDT